MPDTTLKQLEMDKIDGLPQLVGQGELSVLPTAGVHPMLFYQFSEPKSLVKFADQNQAAVGLL
jgi:hypothetical protein